ncbi:MAG: HAMP domain-containing histidine kinase [Dorea sp.]|jgi:two-component system sensor histidine kinase SenX3|nr:HAMP domain-containing histidine kinase [Dorea sp.]
MFGRKTLDRLDKMLDEAVAGKFRESDYDETQLSRIETKWERYLGLSVLTRENLEKEKESVKSLVSDISHQTKTPMANIQLYGELLRENLESGTDSGEKEQNLKLLNEIIKQAEKLDFLIQSLMKMSRLESNIVEVKPCRQKISELILAAMQDAGPKARQKGIELINTYEGEGTADYDMKWTKEALGNVLDNAVKYSGPGGSVRISVTEYELYTAVSVKDDGIGIREEDAAKIFGRFYRAKEVQQEDGVGIGLYLTREILRKENGYIKVKSRPQKGAEFVLYLRREAF